MVEKAWSKEHLDWGEEAAGLRGRGGGSGSGKIYDSRGVSKGRLKDLFAPPKSSDPRPAGSGLPKVTEKVPEKSGDRFSRASDIGKLMHLNLEAGRKLGLKTRYAKGGYVKGKQVRCSSHHVDYSK